MPDNYYVFQAALLCEPCAVDRMARLEPGEDSNNYPQGPYECGGGMSEGDTPDHCDACNVFLRNRLTPDGVLYVIEKVAERGCQPINGVLAEWMEFYRSEINDMLDSMDEQPANARRFSR